MIKNSNKILSVLEKDIKILQKKPQKFWKNKTIIGNEAFAYLFINRLDVPEGIVKIEDSAFAFCNQLQHINLPSTLKYLGSLAFNECSELIEVNLPDGLEVIKSYTFSDCVKLAKVGMPKNLKRIEKSAFWGCIKLNFLEIPESVEIIENNAFANCNFNYVYKLKNCKSTFYSDKLPNSEEVESFLDLNIFYKNLNEFEPESCVFNYDFYLKVQKLFKDFNKNKGIIEAINYNLNDKFIDNFDFRFFENEILLNPKLANKQNFINEEYAYQLYVFASKLGCFSNEKMLDKNGNETDIILAQKACTLLSRLIELDDEFLTIVNGHDRICQKHKNLTTNHEFIKFITQKGTNSLETLIKLEKENPGIFIAAMTDFKRIKNGRKQINKEGKIVKLSLEQTFRKVYMQAAYSNVEEENEDIAKLFLEKGVDEETFDKASEFRKIAIKKDIKGHILNKPIKEPVLAEIEKIKAETEQKLQQSKNLLPKTFDTIFTFEWLDKNDARNFILGLYCNCCATIAANTYGKKIAKAAATSEDVQNLVICDTCGEIVAKGAAYVNREQGYVVFNDFEMNEKYRKGEIENMEGFYISKEDSLVSRQRQSIFEAFMRGIDAFVKEYDKQHPQNPIQMVTVGQGYNRLKKQCESLKHISFPLEVPSDYGFWDAEEGQNVLYESDDCQLDVYF